VVHAGLCDDSKEEVRGYAEPAEVAYWMAIRVNDPFWLIDWLDSNDLHTDEDVDRYTNGHGFLDALIARAEDYESCKPSPVSTQPVLAGRGLDLSGEITGGGTPELIAEVDAAFGTLWHYFDEILVEGFAARRFLQMCHDGNLDLARYRVQSHSKLLLHLRQIGALDHVTFYQKPNPCIHHGEHGDILRHAGLDGILAEATRLIGQFKGGELVDWLDHGDHLHYHYRHPLIGDADAAIWFQEPIDVDLTDKIVIELVARHFFELHAEYVAADIAAADELAVPLAVSPLLRDTVVDQLSSRPAAIGGLNNEVAVEVGLPILSGVSAADIIKIRNDESDAFERFRSGLRIAIREQLKTVDASGNVPSVIASAIVDEYISPGLSDIEQRLNVARRALARKSATNVSVGAISVFIGLMAAMPLITPAGIALGLAAPGVHYAKYLDEKASIELSDLYFLWKMHRIVGGY
jgi:hypothetical protein